MKIRFKKLHPEAITPTRARDSDAGYDLYSLYPCVIDPMHRSLISTGISLEIPEGYYGRVAPRSGLAFKRAIDVLGGVIDSGYRDEISVILINLNSPETFSKQNRALAEHSIMFGQRNRFRVGQGDRIAQLIIEKCHSIEFEEAEELSISDRASDGFGSSGI